MKQCITVNRGQANSRNRHKSEPEPLIPDREGPERSDPSLFRPVQPSFTALFDSIWQNFGLAGPKAALLEPMTLIIHIPQSAAAREGRIRLSISARRRCPVCHGHGGIGLMACDYCRGQGYWAEELPLMITYPAGVVSGHQVQLSPDQLGINNLYLNVIFRVGPWRRTFVRQIRR